MVGARSFLGSRAGYRRAERARRRDDGGSTLIEVLIAFSVLFLVLTGLGFEMATQYSSVGASRNEQTGQALLARALNEVRAMPYTVVAKGLSATDGTATGTLTYVVTSGTVWIFKDAALAGHGTGEAISHYTPVGSTPPPPFYPHKATTTVNDLSYTVLAFPTKYGSSVSTSDGVETVSTWTSRVLRVTVIVSWRAFGTQGNNGTPTTIVGQTLVFDKTAACATLGAVNSTSAAPCQPDFTAAASAGNGVIAVKPASTTTPPIKGLSFTTFDLVLAGTSTTETLTQTSSVLGTAEATGGTLAPTSTLDQLTRVVSKSTNDPAAGTSDYSKATFVQTAHDVTLSSSSDTSTYSLTATPSSADAGTSVSTTSATTARPCTDFTGAARTSKPPLPCGNGQVTPGGTATLSAQLAGLGQLSLASVTAPTAAGADRVFATRYAKGTGTCIATAGCVEAAARGGLGQVTLAGLPAQIAADGRAPSGWSGYLVKLSGYRLQATAWAKGSSSGYLAGSATVSAAGTLSYYTATSHAYTTKRLSGSAGALTIPALAVTDGTVTVTITPALSTGGVQCTQQTPGAGSGRPHIEDCSASSPVSGTITYDITRGTTTIADFVLTVNLGLVSASASYQVAT